MGSPSASTGWAPKVSKGRPESPLVASAEAKAPEKQKKKVKALSLAFHKKSISCERFRPPAGGRGTFPARESTQRAPGAAKGCMSHGRPRTPVAKLQCTASLAGARPAGFTSVPGRATVAFKVGFHFVKAKSLRDPRIRLWRKRGLAQLIPPPAPGRRIIPRVVARGRCDRDTLLRYVPRLRCQAICVPDAAPDWLLAQSQTKWRARYGPCRSRGKGKYPFRYKGGPGVSLGRLKGV